VAAMLTVKVSWKSFIAKAFLPGCGQTGGMTKVTLGLLFGGLLWAVFRGRWIGSIPQRLNPAHLSFKNAANFFQHDLPG